MTNFRATTEPIRIPIWLKIGVGFLLSLLIPTLIIVSVFSTARQDIDRQTIASYIQQNGQRQRQVIVSNFVRARESLADFADNRDTNRLLVGLLLADVESNPQLPSTSNEEMGRVMGDILIDPAVTQFQEVRLLNREGRIIAWAGRNPTEAPLLNQDESNTDAYTQINDLRQNNPETRSTIVVSRAAGGIIEMVQTVSLRNTDNVLGYLVARVNVQDAILPTLQFDDAIFPAYSFLLSDSGLLVVNSEYADSAELSRTTAAVDRAFQNEVGFEIYRIDNGTGDEVGGYFAPIQGTPFILITQVSTEAILGRTTDYFGAGGFAISIGIAVILLLGIVSIYNYDLTRPIRNLQRAIQAASVGNFEEPVPDINRRDEYGDLARSFVEMREQTQVLITDLERRIARRTRDVETTQEISRVAVTQRDLQRLMDDVVNLIIERFGNIYHAQIFLLDNDKRFAVLRASTGVIGQELIARGHRLAVGSVSVIGQVTSQNEIIVARDANESEVHKRNEFLSETRAELAIPLRIGNVVIGALDVQSRESATFDNEQIVVLETMADQLAIAIENTRLYQESLQRLRTIENQSRMQTKNMWQNYLFDRRTNSIVHQAGTATDTDLDHMRERAMISGKPIVGNPTERQTLPIAIPLILRGEPIGVIAWELPAKDYNGDKIQLAQDLAERVALSLDNTRLFEQSNRATERERIVNSISAQLTIQTDVDEILQTAVKEVGKALQVPQVSIRLSRRNTDVGYSEQDSTDEKE